MFRDTKLLLQDILECIAKIRRYTQGLSFDDFLSNTEKVDAVARNFEIIGEAVSRVPIEVKNKYPHVHWQRIKGLRNRIIHDYFGIDYKIVWTIVQNQLDDLEREINIVKEDFM